MANRFYKLTSQDGSDEQICFHCPGCDYIHSFRIRGNGAIWVWDGDLDKATFSPSLLVRRWEPDHRCHSFVRAGKIEFLNDCSHALKGQTVDVPEVDS